MDPSGSQDSGRKGGRRPGKKPQPMKFMFIDSTDHGTNAKPDKAVRSFVMHQARRQKPWSTRKNQPLPSPQEEDEDCTEPSSAGIPPSQIKSKVGKSSILDLRLSQIGDPTSPDAWNVQGLTSPISSRTSNLSTNSRSGSQPCITPLSSRHGNNCDDPNCIGESCSRVYKSLARRDDFAAGVLDPFDSLPVRTNPQMSALLDHFVSIISPRLLPVDLHQSARVANSKWVANSLQHATSAPFAYAVLTTSALQLQTFGTLKLKDTLYYKAQAISEINKLLSDSKNSIDDNNIAAVFMLLCLEESQLVPGNNDDNSSDWNEEHRKIHRNGLQTMIQQRGGLAGLTSNRSLQVFLLMHSVAHAISTFQPPYATLMDANGNIQSYDLPSFRPRPSSQRILRLFRDLRLDAELFLITSNIVVFTGDISAWYEDSRCPIEPLELQKHACLLMYRLYDWYSKEPDSEETRNPIDQSICLGLIIFMVKAAQPYDPSYRAMILTTVKKLRAALTRASIFLWAKSPDLLLWTLTMGAVAAQGSSEAGFFSQYCSVAFADAGIDNEKSADELLDRMRKCLWVPMLFDDEVKKLWVQMGLAKGDAVKEEQREEGVLSPEIKDDNVVGLLTSTRFFLDKRS